MIRLEEIQEIAGRVGLQTQVVEKDFALGWFLAGIYNHAILRDHWVFKGGTCLKKCFFETYRFSEDLDFTVINQPTAASADQLKQMFTEVAQWIQENAGLEIPTETIEFEVFQNPRGTVSIQGKAGYRGPVRPQINVRNLPKIKIDLTFDEPLILPSVRNKVDHPYSDAPQQGIFAITYAYEEVFAEKTRALVQRLRPRDLYDVIHLHRRKDLKPDLALVRSTLEAKCRLRNVAVPTIEAIQTHANRQLLESEWETMLAHQVPTLPPFQQFLDELPIALSWVRGEEQEALPVITTPEAEESVSITTPEPAGNLIPAIGASNMEKIRFAAANRLQIQLGYQGSLREIEPYSLARRSEGNLLLMAVKTQTGESRSYRFDRIQSLEVTARPFQPRYEVEITSSGYLPIHQLTRTASPSRNRRSSHGPTYIFQCTACHKQFRRKSHDSTLKAHKRSDGRACYGTYGRYLRTDYS